jgi:hypothetical protein
MDDATIRVTDTLKGTRYSALVEDDLRVAYAYLCEGERIISRVWLYNRGAAPLKRKETEREDGPSLNPALYALDNDHLPIARASDVEFVWRAVRGISLLIRIRGEDWAVLIPGMKPGWCRLARRPSPLAYPLSDLPPDAEVPEIRDGR